MPRFVAPGGNAGLLATGTIDIYARPVIVTKGGGVATMKTIVFQLRNPLFSHEGPDLYAKAYAHNRPFATAGPYFTKLSPAQEKQFRLWLIRWHIRFDPNEVVSDYDMRGFWLASHGTAEKPAHGPNAHFPDTWKTPYDTTFSAESKYATKQNPFYWNGDELLDSRTGKPVFREEPRFKHVFVLIPQVVGNRIASHAEAIANYQRTGAHFGWFDTPAHAQTYANALHKEQARFYHSKKKMAGSRR